MDPVQTLNLFITYVDKEGPFLKVWGQAEKSSSIYVEQFLLGASKSFETGIGQIPFETLHVGTLVCAKYKDNKYYRARITNIDYLNDSFVEVSFLDYGNKDLVPSANIRSLENFPSSFLSIPPLATGFIFAEAHCPGGGEWKTEIFEIISKELRYREVQCHLLTQATQYFLIKLFIENTDIGALFISRGLMQPIPLHAQQAVLLSMSIQKKSSPTTMPPQVVPPTEINTFKASTLEPNQQYAVYVSFVNEGPTHFSVQLQQTEAMLAKLMKEINGMNLRMLEDVPLPGTICLARCQEDMHICRAVVTNEVDNLFKVFYVDFGNYETLPMESLYQIPFKYVLPKVMAIRLALNGVDKSTVTLEMMLAFKKFVDNRLLHMKVLPSPKKVVIPKCELWDPETKTSALDVIRRAAQHAYPEPLLLNRGFTQPIKVSYVFSCSRFFVQLASKEQELAKLMEDLQVSSPSSESIDEIKIGLPCCALYEGDNLWYRSEIVDIVDRENVKVRYIDFGNEEIVPVTHLRMVEGELLTVLRPQAIECCLNGYQNMEADLTRDNLLEELILEQNFTMKVSEMLGKKALVELIDGQNYNVASLLLDKIASANSQVSPMLVQAGNKIEHRKSSDSMDNYRGSKKPARDLNKDWSGKNDRSESRNFDRSNEKSWRNDNNKDHRQSDANSNDGSSDGGSWRQGSRGFNQNNERTFRNERSDRHQRGDKPNVNERFSRNRNDNWNKKDTAGDEGDANQSNTATSWNSPANSAAAEDGWESTPSSVRGGYEDKNSREDRFGGYKNKFDGGGDRGERGGRGGRGDWGDSRGGRGGGRSERGDSRGGRSDRGDSRGGRGGGRSEWGDNRGGSGDWGDSRGGRGGTRGGRGDSRGGRGGDRGGRGGGDRSNWQGRDGFKKDGFRKNAFANKRDGSEVSSSGSEKSFKKGPRTSSRNDHGGGRFQNRSQNSFSTANANESWSVSDVSAPIDAAPSTATFAQLEVIGTEAAVVISWFHNPQHFYCQLQSSQTEFRTLMEDIQQFYKNRKTESCPVGAPVVGLFPEDNVLYRAQLLETFGGQFKVFYVDFGNVATINKVWPIEKKFMAMPAQAICCSLNGIGPNGDSWPDTSAFSQCFQKEEYMARFLFKDEMRTYLELWDGQEEITQILIRDNLAAPLAQNSQTDLEIPILLNQQFRVVLKSVNNLTDIIVSLECGLALNCKAHNLETATECFEDVLKAYLEQIVIVYVDNVLENNVLDVTFYDNEGNKLTILNPDEGAFDTVEALCPMLVASSRLYGYVAHADENSICVQPSEYADQLADLLDRMYQTYENMSEDSTIIPEEGYVYAVHSQDGNWYRGRVVSFDDDKATVTYVDYGNNEDVAFNVLRMLQTDFNVPSMMCVKVTLTEGSAVSYLEKEVAVSVYFGETGWEGIVEESPQENGSVEQQVNAVDQYPLQTESGDVQAEDGTLVQEIHTEKEPSQDQIHENAEEQVQGYTGEPVPQHDGEPVPEDAGKQVTDYAGEENLIASEVVYQSGTPVFVSHIDSPTEFYVQFTESASALEELQLSLQDTAESLPVLENISVGVLCAAPYSVDHQWYRAEVLDADDDITTVRFIDYGNTDVINNMNTQIKTLTSNLLTPAMYATRCSLKLKAIQDEWSQPALELFEGLVGQENVIAEFIIQDEKTNIVELYANGKNVKEALLEQSLAVPCEIVTESKTTCFVSHLNSPSEFWVQMENCVDELEWIAEQLSGAEKFPELEDMSPGTLCAALFPDDEMWYRARILSNTIAGIELLFIDYGNSCVSSSLRQLPEDLVVTPPLGQKCCLNKPEGIPYWTKEAQDKFAEISAEGQTIFEMKKITSGETATVDLFLHGESVVSKILPVTEEGYVKKFETLDKFFVEKHGELSSESYGLEPMPGMEWDADSNGKFLEIYPEGTLLEIECISEDTVRLYKNGADIRPLLGGTKTILNTSNAQGGKTDALDNSEDDVIDYQAGGDNLLNTHSSEEYGQVDGEIHIDQSETHAESNQICDKDGNSADSSNITVSEKEAESIDKSNLQESETDSGHHSEHETPNSKNEESRESPEKHTLEIAGQVELNKSPEESEVDVNQEVETEARVEMETGCQNAEDDEKHTLEIAGQVELNQSPEESEVDVNQEIETEARVEMETECQNAEEDVKVNGSPNKETKVQKVESTQEATVKDSEVAITTKSSVVKSDSRPKKEDAQKSSEETNSSSAKSDSSPKKESAQKSSEETNSSPAKSDSSPKKENAQKSSEATNSSPAEVVQTSAKNDSDSVVPPPNSRPSSREGKRLSHDEKIPSGVCSVSHSPVPGDAEEKVTNSRPSSRLSHDDRILPAVLSRPHSPSQENSEDQ